MSAFRPSIRPSVGNSAYCCVDLAIFRAGDEGGKWKGKGKGKGGGRGRGRKGSRKEERRQLHNERPDDRPDDHLAWPWLARSLRQRSFSHSAATDIIRTKETQMPRPGMGAARGGRKKGVEGKSLR